jgi:hypothetical protein
LRDPTGENDSATTMRRNETRTLSLMSLADLRSEARAP